MEPLENVTVLDFTHALAGSACTNCLSRFGAEVIKIERPEVGDDLRHYTEHAGLPGMAIPFCSVNAGKKSVELDLKNPKSRGVLERLVKRADIVVENYRPGVTEKLGVNWETLRKINPRLVYCSVTGFGQTGELRDRTAYDHIVQAMSGIMWVNGEPDGGPLKIGLPAVDTFSGYVATIAVLAALRRRDATGEGERIDVAMLDSALTLMASAVATQIYTGKAPERIGNKGFRLVPTAGTFKARDGYISIGANHQHQVEELMAIIGREELLDDSRFADHKGRVENGLELHEIMKEEIGRWASEELEAALAEARVPVSVVRTLAQITEHPHLADRHLLVDARVPGRDEPLKLVRGAPRLEGASDEAGSVPAVGEHTESVLGDLGYAADEIAALRKAGVI